jgi:hypothetical protein
MVFESRPKFLVLGLALISREEAPIVNTSERRSCGRDQLTWNFPKKN